MLVDLRGQLAGRRHDQRAGGAAGQGRQALQDRQQERGGLAAAGHGAREHVAAGQAGGNRVALDGGGRLEAQRRDAAEQVGVKSEIRKRHGAGNLLRAGNWARGQSSADDLDAPHDVADPRGGRVHRAGRAQDRVRRRPAKKMLRVRAERVDLRHARSAQADALHRHGDADVEEVGDTVGGEQRPHDQVHVELQLHPDDVVLEGRVAQPRGRDVLVREVQLDVVGRHAVEGREMDAADVGAEEEAALAEGLRPFGEDRSGRDGRAHGQAVDDRVGGTAARGADRRARGTARHRGGDEVDDRRVARVHGRKEVTAVHAGDVETQRLTARAESEQLAELVAQALRRERRCREATHRDQRRERPGHPILPGRDDWSPKIGFPLPVRKHRRRPVPGGTFSAAMRRSRRLGSLKDTWVDPSAVAAGRAPG